MEFIAILRNLLTLPLNVYLCLQVLVSIPKISHKTLQLECYGFKEFIMAQKLHNIQYLIESIYNDIIIEFECDCLPQGTKSNSNFFPWFVHKAPNRILMIMLPSQRHYEKL